MADIIQINNSTWRIEDNGVRFFLLTGTEKALLLTAEDTPNAKEIAESITKLPIAFSTHMLIPIIFRERRFRYLLYAS